MSTPFYKPSIAPPKIKPEVPDGVLLSEQPVEGAVDRGKTGTEEKKSPWDRFIHWAAKKRNPGPLFVALILFSVILAFVVALTDPQKGLGWLISSNNPTGREILDVGVALAPLLALALAIERVIETVFDLFERATEQVAQLGTAGETGYQWIMGEYNRYQNAFYEVTQALNTKARESERVEILKLEIERDQILQKMEKVRSWIDSFPKDPMYVSFKRMLSIWSGLFLGSVIAILSSDAGIFRYLNIEVPRFLDLIVTGFVIGAGASPMHSLIGILQGGKDALSNLGKKSAMDFMKQQLEDVQGEVQAISLQQES